MHGVPSGKMSCGSIGKHVSFKLILQHLLHASATINKIQHNDNINNYILYFQYIIKINYAIWNQF